MAIANMGKLYYRRYKKLKEFEFDAFGFLFLDLLKKVFNV